MNETQKKKVGGTPTLKNLSSKELLEVILGELENVRSQISAMRLLVQQRRWAALAQANKDLSVLLQGANVTLREIDRRADKMIPRRW